MTKELKRLGYESLLRKLLLLTELVKAQNRMLAIYQAMVEVPELINAETLGALREAGELLVKAKLAAGLP